MPWTELDLEQAQAAKAGGALLSNSPRSPVHAAR
ncbi:MAG: hypothetical protein QOG35_2250 [Solirubrobacteraceae bacterium]|jgi:hypothetical protein|nr:hypothetical protein [Solirubrobacteraceae bacterium]